MYHNGNHKQHILLEQKLVEIYAKKGDRKHGKKYVYRTLAWDWIGESEETFVDHANTRKYRFPGEETSLGVEATLRSLERNRKMAKRYEEGLISLSEIPVPEYQDLVDAIKARMKKAARKTNECEK